MKSYVKDSYNELVNKVTWPTWKELQNSAIVVMVASLIIALFIFGIDSVFQFVMKGLYSLFF